MAGGALLAVLAFPVTISAQIVSTITIPTGSCVPSLTGSVNAGFTPGPQAASVDYVFQVASQNSLRPRANANNISWIGADGVITSVCGQSERFSLQNHTLQSGGHMVSTSPNTTWAPFAANLLMGPITTDFTLIDEYLAWVNQAFSGGAAKFCIASGKLYTVFSGIGPASCVGAKLLAVSADSDPCKTSSTVAPLSSTSPSNISHTASSASSTVNSSTTDTSSTVATSDASSGPASSAPSSTLAQASASLSTPSASSSAASSSAAAVPTFSSSAGEASSSETTSSTSTSSSTPASSSAASTTPIPTPTPSPSSTATPSPFVSLSAGPYSYTTGVRLSHPTPIVSNLKAGDDYDDAAFNVPTDFTIQIYEERNQSFTVSSNGLFTVGDDSDFLGDQFDNVELYASILPPGTVCVFWQDLNLGLTSDMGIYYQTDVSGSNTMLSVEYILTASGSPPADEIYHIILRYDTNAPANAELYYFSTGSGGDLATIGVQGFDSSDNMQSAQFEFDTPDSIAPNDRIVLTTDPNISQTGTAVKTSFVANCYPAGTWPKGVCNAHAP